MSHVTVYEVGPRDGLQNETVNVPTTEKIAFIDRLSTAGLAVIEVSAFVSPKWVPQMADAAEVFRGIGRRPGTRYSALVPNLKGLARASEAGVTEVAVFAAASETFSRRNINQSIDDSFESFREVSTAAAASRIRVRGYLSTAFGCPFEGDVPIARVIDLTKRLLDLGLYEIAVSDTIGIAHPGQVRVLLSRLSESVPVDRLALHFHDTRGTALANVLAGLEMGVSIFDSSSGGLGGCPYAPGASGNLATEDLLYMLDGMGVRTGVKLAQVVEASRFIGQALSRELPSRYLHAAPA